MAVEPVWPRERRRGCYDFGYHRLVKALRLSAVVSVVVMLVIAACQSGAPSGGAARRLVLVSIDGLGADMLGQWIDDGVLEQANGFRAMTENGFSAGRLRMVDPTLTSVNHATLATGARPSATGVLSNYFRRVGTPITESVNGFSAPVTVESLWTTARRQGKQVGVLLWPGSDALALDRMGDFGVMWPMIPLLGSGHLELDIAEAEPMNELPSADGIAAVSWRLAVDLDSGDPEAGTYIIAVLDATPDGTPRYDQVAVRSLADDDWVYVAERGWFETRVEAMGASDLAPELYGAWSKVLHLDRRNGHLKLYRGAYWRLMAYPLDYQQRLVEAIGPWPGPADGRELGKWWLDADAGIDLDTYLEQVERFDRYIDRMAEHAFATETFDLLLTYHSTVDEYLHSSFIVDPEQWPYSPGIALAAREGLKRVARSVDRSVAGLWSALDPAKDVLVVVSDHGLAPLHDVVNLNVALAGPQLVTVEASSGRPRVPDGSPMVALSSGACAHLYLNLIDREPTGVVERRRSQEVLHAAAKVLADLEVGGEPVVEKVVNRQEASALGLGHPDCGDLVAFLRPGFAFGMALEGDVIVPSRYYAQHGYLSHHEAMCGVFSARGAGVKRRRPKEIAATDVAPMVKGWLGLAQ